MRLKENRRFIVSCFYLGYLPFAPGTWGSLFGLIFSLYIHISWVWFFVLFALSWYLICLYDDEMDPGWIVVDEYLGIMLYLLLIERNVYTVVLGFVFFRLFDIWKPFPISWVDQKLLPSLKTRALAVIVDDLIAGVMAYGVVMVLTLLFKFPIYTIQTIFLVF